MADPTPPQKSGKSILGDVATYGFAGVAARALTFFLIPLYTHFLAPADYGILDLVTQIGLVVNTVLMLNGMGMATMTFFLQAKEIEERKQVISSLMMLMGSVAVGAALLIVPFSSFFVQVFELPCSDFVFGLGVMTVLGEMLPAVPYSLMQARVESRRFMFWNLGTLTLRLLVTVLVVAVFRWGVVGILAVRATTGLVAGGILLYQELKGNWQQPERLMITAILRFAAPFVPTGLFALIRNGSQRFFLLAHAGAADLGIYALGATLTGVIGILIVMPFHKVWNAKMYAVYETEGAAKRVGEVATKFVFLYLCGALPLIYFGQLFLRIVSSADYGRAHMVFVPMLLFGLIDTFANIPDQVFFVFRRTKFKAIITGIVAAVSLGLYALVVPRYGMLGAAYGLAFTSLVRVVIIILFSRRIFMIEYEIGRLFALIGISLAVACIGMELPDTWLGLTAKAFLLAAWIGVIYWRELIPRGDFAVVVHFLLSIMKRFVGKQGVRNAIPLGEGAERREVDG